ncbi:MAG: glycosyltransferase [Bacteroidia bacterium]
MRIRIVCSGTMPDFNFRLHQAFIYDQIEALKQLDKSLEFEYFYIKKGGLTGYFRAWRDLLKQQKQSPCDIIHAHGGLPAFLSILQFREKVISTFHGSDINLSKVRLPSAVAAIFSKKSIYVSEQLLEKSIFKGNPAVIPCGVDLSLFKPLQMKECRDKLGLETSKKYILFSSAFNNPVKNYPLLSETLKLWKGEAPEVLELKNISREEVPLYMNAANVCVLCSFTEGSPQFIKEAMACNRPIVSTNVGDVLELFGESVNCEITTFDAQILCEKIAKLIDESKSNGRSRMLNYEQGMIAEKILAIYRENKKKAS